MTGCTTSTLSKIKHCTRDVFIISCRLYSDYLYIYIYIQYYAVCCTKGLIFLSSPSKPKEINDCVIYSTRINDAGLFFLFFFVEKRYFYYYFFFLLVRMLLDIFAFRGRPDMYIRIYIKKNFFKYNIV